MLLLLLWLMFSASWESWDLSCCNCTERVAWKIGSDHHIKSLLTPSQQHHFCLDFTEHLVMFIKIECAFNYVHFWTQVPESKETKLTYPIVTSNILLPMELETAMSPNPFLATKTLVMRSGILVPAARNVSPITCETKDTGDFSKFVG